VVGFSTRSSGDPGIRSLHFLFPCTGVPSALAAGAVTALTTTPVKTTIAALAANHLFLGDVRAIMSSLSSLVPACLAQWQFSPKWPPARQASSALVPSTSEGRRE
jgi:hypothetical protein